MGFQFSALVTGIILVGLFVTVFSLGMAEYNDKYPIDDYDSASFSKYKQSLNDTIDLSKTIKSETNLTSTSRVEALTGFISGAVRSVKLTINSVDTVQTMGDEAASRADVGASGQYIKDALWAILLVTVFIGGLVAAILKWRT